MKYPILEFSNTDFGSFVKQWSSFYNYKYPSDKNVKDYYEDYIRKPELNEESLIKLYEWKNGTPLSGNNENGEHQRKFKGLNNNILEQIYVINELKKNFKLDVFSSKFEKVSFVWKVFLLHIIQPDNYPIYDQHVHRAYLYLQGNIDFKNVENKMSARKKENFYIEQYCPFIKKMTDDYPFSIRDLDKAFFSFGQFLKKYKVDLIE